MSMPGNATSRAHHNQSRLPPLRPTVLVTALAVLIYLIAAATATTTDLTTDSADTTTTTTDDTMAARTVRRLYKAMSQREGAGFVVRRSVGSPQLNVVDPFLMLDHFGPTEYGPGEAVGAPDHPHRGFETVTYMLEGTFHHKDNAGNEGWLGPGWAQWMTAGSGIIHSEMPSDEILEKGGKIEGFQLWVNLPAKDKMIKPRYQDTPPDRIPKVKTADGKGTIAVVAGEALGTKAVIDTRSPIMFLDVQLDEGGSFTEKVPSTYDGFVYVYRGAGRFGDDKTPASESYFFQLGDGDEFTASADSAKGVRFLLIAGQPLREPVARYGPFVMNTQAELRQAIIDFNSGRFGKEIDGAEDRARKTEQAKRTQRETGRWNRDNDEL